MKTKKNTAGKWQGRIQRVLLKRQLQIKHGKKGETT
jgi:hypothetical protein